MLDSTVSPEKSRDLELAARKSQIREVLRSRKLTSPQRMGGGKTFLRDPWLIRLNNELDPAIKRAQERTETTAVVLQFADAALDFGPDEDFANAFLEEFGATAKIGGREIPVSTRTLPKIVKDPQLPRIDNKDVMEGLINTAITTQDGHFHSLVVDTKIDGVRLAMDGSSLDASNRLLGHTLRLYLLVKI